MAACCWAERCCRTGHGGALAPPQPLETCTATKASERSRRQSWRPDASSHDVAGKSIYCPACNVWTAPSSRGLASWQPSQPIPSSAAQRTATGHDPRPGHSTPGPIERGPANVPRLLHQTSTSREPAAASVAARRPTADAHPTLPRAGGRVGLSGLFACSSQGGRRLLGQARQHAAAHGDLSSHHARSLGPARDTAGAGESDGQRPPVIGPILLASTSPVHLARRGTAHLTPTHYHFGSMAADPTRGHGSPSLFPTPQHAILRAPCNQDAANPPTRCAHRVRLQSLAIATAVDPGPKGPARVPAECGITPIDYGSLLQRNCPTASRQPLFIHQPTSCTQASISVLTLDVNDRHGDPRAAMPVSCQMHLSGCLFLTDGRTGCADSPCRSFRLQPGIPGPWPSKVCCSQRHPGPSPSRAKRVCGFAQISTSYYVGIKD